MEAKNYTIDDENRRITIAGSLEELVEAIKAIHRAKYPNQDPRKLDEEIDVALAEEMPHMAAYLKGEVGIEEFWPRHLPQLTFGMLHRIRLSVDHEAEQPKIIAKYFANDLPGENCFAEIRANFERALKGLE